MRVSLSCILLLVGCPGTLEITGLSPVDDDSVGGDDDSVSDDDTVVDDDTVSDDDSVGDDDDFDWSEVSLHGFLLSSQHHPEGRWSWGYLWADDQSPAGVRGGDEPCTVDSGMGMARGGGVYYDLGDSIEWGWDAGNEPWRMGMGRVEDQGQLYYYKDAADPPRGIPPWASLDLRSSGGDLPELSLLGIIETPPVFEVERPAVPDGEAVVVISPDDGLGFQWSSLGEEWVEIGLDVADWNGGSTTITCYVPDDGAFVVGADLLWSLPQGVDGSAWLRRYRQTNLPAIPEGPGLELAAARQHDWTVRLEASTDPNGGN